MRISQFKTHQAGDRFRTAYERTLAELWPGPRTALDLPTTFGTTRAYRTGPQTGEPIVLLPGSGGNALMWHRYIDTLARHHPVIAVDTVGEPGASVQTAPICTGRDGAAWLDELLAALDVTDAHLVGCSYGGWLALNHQIHHPGRTATLTLVDPAGFADFGPRFYTWLIAGALAATAPRPLRPPLARLVGNSAILETELMNLMRASMGFRRALPVPPILSDEELHRLRVPALFLLGARSAMHDSRKVADRLGRLVPSARVEIVPGAGHALPTDQPDLVVDRILSTVGQ
ncbi:pimeloyl-ACP methyl ester carboxylesterase [Streptomyces sp. 1114.5]|uniref:alpha/beta fold hydrolase n=1 Tax=Streptomyces sp. 1114.5 TaxID=1938830 RepID=UPI000EB46623|nr:alpha/beta fold hydrolase [Streptomyces sp. 1114.5]RKT09658.1 pimeloyl-ACP methyl ester carboxylesterase [Streptomyces sp. 1114.5]